MSTRTASSRTTPASRLTARAAKATFTTTHGKGGTGGARIEASPTKRGQTEGQMLYAYEGKDDKHYDQEAYAFVGSVLGTGEGEDKYRNDTKYGVESTFTAILGREAAYRRTTLEWDKVWKESERLAFRDRA
jgi:aryl-phospho-beta-D-glucosidase BglC (GH1 family)